MTDNTAKPSGVRARLREWLFPGFDKGQEAVREIVRTQRKQAAVLTTLVENARTTQKSAEAQSQAIRRVTDRVSSVRHAVRRLEQDSFDRAWKAGGHVAQHQLAVWRVNQRLARMADRDEPILVGPWTGEIGFEVLYWVPFVTWAAAAHGLPRERIVAVSRGGAGLWYDSVAARYVDILDFYTPEDYRAETEASKKQSRWRRFDTAVIRKTLETLGARRASLLHPSLMYRSFIPVWRQRVPYATLDELTLWRSVARPDLGALAGQLPEKYVAVKFYASRQFPATSETRAFVARVINRLAREHHVVVIGSGARLDEHEDFPVEYSDRVHSIQAHLTAATNLDVQTRIVANATAFVGSYGGFSYLAPYYGVPAVSYYESHDAFFDCHLDFARRVFTPPKGPGFVVLDVRETRVIDSLIGG